MKVAAFIGAYLVLGWLTVAIAARAGMADELRRDDPPAAVVLLFWPMAAAVMVIVGFAALAMTMGASALPKEPKLPVADLITEAAQREVDTIAPSDTA